MDKDVNNDKSMMNASRTVSKVSVLESARIDCNAEWYRHVAIWW